MRYLLLVTRTDALQGYKCLHISFIHRLLLDYFASLETPSSEEAFAASALLQKLDNYSAGASRRPARLPGRGVPGRIPASRRRKQRRRKET